MIVREIMKRDIGTCAPGQDLSAAIHVMQEQNCGFVPVVDARGKVAGVLTDRDICLAIGKEADRKPSRIAVSETMTRPVYSCLPDENVKVALATMAKHHVRRLPVVDQAGSVQGVLSIDDVVRIPRRRGAPTAGEIVEAMRAVVPPHPVEV